jgi:transposase
MTNAIDMTKTAMQAEFAAAGIEYSNATVKKWAKADMADALEKLRAEPVEAGSPAADDDKLQAVLDKLTAKEKQTLVAYLDAGMDCNGAETLDAMKADNMTWGDVPEIAKRTGLAQKSIKGVIASLDKKGLLVITDEGVNGEGPVQQVLADFGLVVAFELIADGIEAMAPKAAPNPAKADKGPRVLKPHVFCQPVDKPEQITSLKAGSKKHLLAKALWDGATIEELDGGDGLEQVDRVVGLFLRHEELGLRCRASRRSEVLPAQAQGPQDAARHGTRPVARGRARRGLQLTSE